MEKISGVDQLQQNLNSAKTIFIVLPQTLNHDKLAAGLSLFLSLKKGGKKSEIFCSRPITVEFSSLVGVNQIKNQLEGKNLVICFDYVEDSIEKVTSNIVDNKFNLIIQPKEGYPPLSPEKVQYFYTGANADLFLVIGTSHLEDLGEIYFKNKSVFEEGKIFTLDLVNFPAASYSEIIVNLLEQLKTPVDEDIASNLLVGIQEATNNFTSPKITPETFEAAAWCLRLGARPKGKRENIKPKVGENSAVTPATEEPSPDWLQPKIYKGNTLI